MGRVIRTESGASRRHRILSAMGLALRAASQDSTMTEAETRDVLAFLALGLAELLESVDETARAWEKREYWLKADRFRSEWAWVEPLHERLRSALGRRDWSAAQGCGMDLAKVLAERRVRLRVTKAMPWRGAWDAWVQKR